MERRFEQQAEMVCNAIKMFAENEQALDNFKCYLSMHFDKWLEKWASTPDGMAEEMKDFAEIY